MILMILMLVKMELLVMNPCRSSVDLNFYPNTTVMISVKFAFYVVIK